MKFRSNTCRPSERIYRTLGFYILSLKSVAKDFIPFFLVFLAVEGYMGSPGVKGKKQTFRILSNSSFEHKMSQNTKVLTYLFYSVSNTKIFSIIFFLPLQHNLKLNH